MKVLVAILILGGLAFFFRDKVVLLLDSFYESRIVKNYSDGEVDKCTLNNKVYYSVAKNSYNASGFVLDNQGAKAGICNYADDLVDSICRQLEECKAIYRVYPNIWGLPEVKYNPS